MKKGIIILILIILLIIVGYIFLNNTNSNKTAESSNESIGKNIISEIENSNIPNNTINIKTSPKEEIELASFSTNLQGDSARLNNIKVTCNTINNTIIDSGNTFSFNDIVGNPSAEKGYQEADVIVETKVEKGYGGGNCQVSTTIYNACLQISDIEILERNPHLKKVTYIEEGKDAAVSYTGNLDFEFKNNFDVPIKIYMNTDDDLVTAKIVKIQ